MPRHGRLGAPDLAAAPIDWVEVSEPIRSNYYVIAPKPLTRLLQ